MLRIGTGIAAAYELSVKLFFDCALWDIAMSVSAGTGAWGQVKK